MIEFADVEAARRRIRDHIYETPCAFSATLSEQTGARVYLKLENLQMTGSYKERGALNRLARLVPDARTRGVIAASAGNHAQGVAFHATRLEIPAVIVMPIYTPLVKVTSTQGYGAQVVLHGESFDEAYAEAERRAADQGYILIHAFDDPDIVAGQGTVGLELLEQNPYLDAVVVPIGGGGLIAGIALAIKETNPRIQVWGVETAAMPAMKASLDAGVLTEVPFRSTLAEGIAVRRVGRLPFELCQRYVDGVVTVSDEEIASAVLTLLEVEKTVVEGAGAAPLAALANGHLPQLAGKKVALVVTGGNIDVTVLSRIIRRGLANDGRMVRLRVQLPDTPGALAGLTQALADLGTNVVDIRHNRAFVRGPLGEAQVTLTLETRGHDHVNEIVTSLGSAGISVSRE